MKVIIFSRQGAKLPRPAFAPDLHPCRPRPQRFFLASLASWREYLWNFDSFV